MWLSNTLITVSHHSWNVNFSFKFALSLSHFNVKSVKVYRRPTNMCFIFWATLRYTTFQREVNQAKINRIWITRAFFLLVLFCIIFFWNFHFPTSKHINSKIHAIVYAIYFLVGHFLIEFFFSLFSAVLQNDDLKT